MKQERQEFALRGSKPPAQGKESSLAGIAEPGALLTVNGLGTFENQGTKAEPNWQPYQPARGVFIITSGQDFDRPQRSAGDPGPSAKQSEPGPRGLFGRQGKPR